MLKKLIAVISAGLVLFIFAGCSGNANHSATSRTASFERPAESYEVRRDGHGDYFMGAFVLSFDPKTGDDIQMTARLPVNLKGIPVVATLHFQVRKHYGGAEYQRVNSVALIADGVTLVNADNSNKSRPWLDKYQVVSVGSGDRVHTFYVETSLEVFNSFVNGRKLEVLIDGKRFALTSKQRDAIRLMGQRGNM